MKPLWKWRCSVMWNSLFPNIDMQDLWVATYETFYMTILALIGAFVFGILLGLLLYLTMDGGIWQNKVLNMIVASIVNIFRAIPFIILILLLFPFTDFLIRSEERRVGKECRSRWCA